MDDPFFVGRCQAARNLHSVIDRLAQWQGSAPHGLRQRHPLQQLRHQIRNARVGSHLVHRKNVRMVQSRRGFRFHLEALQPLRFRQDQLRQNFDGYIALQPGVARAVHFAHAARPNRREDFILTESSARGQGHGCGNYSSRAKLFCIETKLPRPAAVSLTHGTCACNLTNHRRERSYRGDPHGGSMKLLLETREVGRVTIVRCKGRIVAGGEVEALRAHVAHLLRDRRSLVLHLGEVVFIDSSGLGTMVRTLTSTRQARGDMKLCDVPEPIRKVLQLSHLHKLFDSHESEDHAVAAFYRAPVHTEKPVSTGRSVLCIDRNADVVTYVRELLRNAGYDVHTSNNLRDALILMRVSRFDLLLLGAELAGSPATEKSFRDLCAAVPCIELGGDFSTLDAGQAASALLEKIATHLQPAS